MKSTLRKTGYEELDVDMIRGDGSYVYDEDDGKYLDFEAGVWCCALGHNHRAINNAIMSQLDRISHTGYTFINRVAETSSRKVLDLLGFTSGKCSFLSSGTEAVELAVSIGKTISDGKLILVLSNQYFGSYGSAMNRDSRDFYTFDYNECKTCRKNKECDLTCKTIRKIPFEKIDTFLFEPGGKGGLAQFPPKGLIDMIGKIIRGNNGHIIVNEVTTGLGRTGKWFGFQHYGITPDIVALGKILGNGYPVSAVALNSKACKILDSRTFHYGQSHTNDPLGCIVAGAVIDTLQSEKLIEKSKEIGDFFLKQLKNTLQYCTSIREIRGRGMIICVEFSERISTEMLLNLYHKLVGCGYIVGLIKNMNSIRFMPSFVLRKEEVIEFIGCLKRILFELRMQ